MMIAAIADQYDTFMTGEGPGTASLKVAPVAGEKMDSATTGAPRPKGVTMPVERPLRRRRSAPARGADRG
jgi:hypothetical protein